MLLRRASIAVLLISVLFGSFFITLWLTAPSAPTDDRSDADRLAAFAISNDSELTIAVQHIPLRPSQNLVGNVDVLTRTSQDDVTAAGWFADRQAGASPLVVLVFDGGPLVGRTLTKGERADVTEAQHLTLGAQRNVIFSITFKCHVGDQPVIVGIGSSHQYLLLQSSRCP
jgi:hypothetical protein